MGCWTDLTDNIRALSAKSTSSPDGMTLQQCATFCDGYKYFGTEYGGECYCGNAPDPSSGPADLADCYMPCTGNPLQYCGAGYRLELYENEADCEAVNPPVVGAYSFFGCQVDLIDGVRTLIGDDLLSDDMTAAKCADFCHGYSYFGLEFGRECYCSNAPSLAPPAPALECNMICAGDGKELCGSADRLSVYRLSSLT